MIYNHIKINHRHDKLIRNRIPRLNISKFFGNWNIEKFLGVIVFILIIIFFTNIQNNNENIYRNKIDINILEKKVHDLINEERQKSGLIALSYDSKLADIARKHSMDMVNKDFFDHVNSQGDNPTMRGLKYGYQCYKDYGSYYTEGIAENIQRNSLYNSIEYIVTIPFYNKKNEKEIAQSVVNNWMNSTGHRQNILTLTYDKEGIGIAISSDGKILITEDFC